MADTIIYLTELLGLTVYDLKGRALGRVKDAALVPLVDPARIDRFLIGAGNAWLTIRYDQVGSIALDGIRLRQEHLTPYHSDEYMLRMVRDVLDHQIIDAHGRKVVRVTDITFEIRVCDGYATLLIQEVDIGLRSVFRRLMQGALPRRWIRKLQGPIAPSYIRWEYCNIIEPDPMRRLRLNISPKQLEELHPADLADIVEELPPDSREAVLTSIDSEAAAEALSEMETDVQVSIIESLEAEKAAEIIEEMAPDEAADVLQELEEETSGEILEEMEPDPKSELQELLEYGEHSAGGLMNTEFVALSQDTTVEAAIASLKSAAGLLDTLNAIILTDGGERLAGSVPLGRLFAAPLSLRLADLSAQPLVFVGAEARESKVTELFDKYNLLTLPVVDDRMRLLGVITADDVITVLRGDR
jgi:sporulation protein YlmC with PRC-barrel domain/CBS domain-containing protein